MNLTLSVEQHQRKKRIVRTYMVKKYYVTDLKEEHNEKKFKTSIDGILEIQIKNLMDLTLSIGILQSMGSPLGHAAGKLKSTP